MEDKYYLPKIEEFHVGFEYETIYLKSVWTKESLDVWDCGWFFESYHNDASPLEFRVKSLDKEDIESLGFILTGKPTEVKMYFRTDDDKYGISLRDNFYPEGFSNLHIYEFINERVETFFRGKIENKTELIKLFKQLEIL